MKTRGRVEIGREEMQRKSKVESADMERKLLEARGKIGEGKGKGKRDGELRKEKRIEGKVEHEGLQGRVEGER